MAESNEIAAAAVAAGADDDEAVDLSVIDGIVERLGRDARTTIPILQAIQTHFRYLPREALERVCEITDITPAEISGVSTFYTQFRHRPVGKHLVKVCHGTACHVVGAKQITDSIRRHLGITDEEEDTDAAKLFTVEKVPCLGCCSLAPCMLIDDVTYGRLTPHSSVRIIVKIARAAEGQGGDSAE